MRGKSSLWRATKVCRVFAYDILAIEDGFDISFLFSQGLALAPWDVLCSGKIRTDAEEQRRLESGEQGRRIISSEWRRNDDEKRMCKVLEEIAEEISAASIQAG